MHLSAAVSPATVTLGDLVQTYNGAPRVPSVVTQPLGLPVQLVYRNLSPSAPPAVSQIVYNDTPDPLPLSYFSYGFEAQKLSGLGNLVQLAGTARKLESGEVILVNYAKASDWPALAAANPVGYTHPVTLTIYEVTPGNQFVFRTEVTQNILIPWKPITAGYPYISNALRATIPFPNGITLPERVLVMVNYNTQTSGFAPIGVPGPYNSLNVAQKYTVNVIQVGSDVDPDVVLQVRNGQFLYPSTGWTTTSAPMIRLNALSTDTITPPVNAGTWLVSARVSNPDYLGTASANFTVQPGAQTFSSWLAPWVSNGLVPGNATGGGDDPDFDGIPNLMEYALALDPSTGSHGLPNSGLPVMEFAPGTISLIYRKNLAAADLQFQVESTVTPGVAVSWSQAVTMDTVLFTVGPVQTIRASLAIPPAETTRFMRLSVRK